MSYCPRGKRKPLILYNDYGSPAKSIIEREVIATWTIIVYHTPNTTVSITLSLHQSTEEWSLMKGSKVSYASYSYVEGSSSCQWTKGTSGTLPFTFKRSMNDKKTFDSFTGASIDGKEMTQGVLYTIEKGSLKIYLKDSMLNTLSVGTHVLKVTFKDGEATTTFRVIEKSSGGGSSSKDYNPPKTGIEQNFDS